MGKYFQFNWRSSQTASFVTVLTGCGAAGGEKNSLLLLLKANPNQMIGRVIIQGSIRYSCWMPLLGPRAATDESSTSKTLSGRRKETSSPTSTVWVIYLISTLNGQSQQRQKHFQWLKESYPSPQFASSTNVEGSKPTNLPVAH